MDMLIESLLRNVSYLDHHIGQSDVEHTINCLIDDYEDDSNTTLTHLARLGLKKTDAYKHCQYRLEMLQDIQQSGDFRKKLTDGYKLYLLDKLL